MTIGSIFVGLALVIILVLVVARPFITPPPAMKNRPSKHHRMLMEKEQVLDEINALDFDFDTGKMPEEVYLPQREYMLKKAENIYKSLDDIHSKTLEPAAGNGKTSARDLDAEIEAAVSRQRQQSAPDGQTAARQAGKFCPQCGKPTEAGDKFCANCGQRLVTGQPS